MDIDDHYCGYPVWWHLPLLLHNLGSIRVSGFCNPLNHDSFTHVCSSSSDDYKYFMMNSTSSQALAHHLHQQDHPSPTHTRSYLGGQSAMQAQQQNLFNNMIMADNGPYGVAPSYPNPTDCLDLNSIPTTSTATNSGVATGQNEHYIYVTYPPELKRRLLERYDREVYSVFKK